MPDPTKATPDEGHSHSLPELAVLFIVFTCTGIVLSVLVLYITGGL